MIARSAKRLVQLLAGLLAASLCHAAASNDTGVTSGQLDVLAAQPKSVTCDAPAPLGQYDSYCEGLQVDYFLLPKQRRAPSLTGLKPNISSFVPNLNGTAAPANFKGINAAAAAKTYSFAVRYTGVLFIDQSGTYNFQLNSPSGTRLTVNGNTVTFNQGSNSSSPTTGYKFSKAGYIPIELVFFNENSIPSVSLQWQGPLDSLYTTLEGSSIQFNCSFLQNTTNSSPATSSALCSGLSAVYYSNWKNNSYALATSAADFTHNEPALNHWSTDTTPYWSGLPTSLQTKFAARYHGQLWVPLPGKYTFKLAAVQNASLYLGSNNILNNSAPGRATLKAPATATFEFASSGYYPLGLNYVTQQSGKSGSLRLTWMGPNSPAYKVVSPFRHICSTFVACTNTSTNGALPAPVVGMTPSGSTIESSSARRSPSLATFFPNSNVTFTLTFPFLDASDPNVEDVSYFAREAVANAAGLRLESVWTVPQLDDDGNVIFPLGAYFTSVASAQRFYNTVNLRPQSIFQSSSGLEDFYPIRVSSPAMGTTIAMATPVQSARPTATLVSATGEGDNIPLPLTPRSPTVLGAPAPNASSPVPTQTPQAIASPIAEIPQADTPTPTPAGTAATPAPSQEATPTASAPAESTPSPTAAAPVESTATPTAAAPVESTPSPTAAAPVESTSSPTAAAPVESTPSPTAAAPVESTPFQTAAEPVESSPSPTAAAPAPSTPEVTPTPTAAAPATETAAAPAEATPTPSAAAPAPVESVATPTATPEASSPSPAQVPTPTAAAPESSPELPTPPPTASGSPTPTPPSPSPTPEAPAPATPTQTPVPTSGSVVMGGTRQTPGATPTPTAYAPVMSSPANEPIAYPPTVSAVSPAASGMPAPAPAPAVSPVSSNGDAYGPTTSASPPTTSASSPTTSAVPVPTMTALAPNTAVPPEVIAPISEPTTAPRPYSPSPHGIAAAPGTPVSYGTPVPTAVSAVPSAGPSVLPTYSPGGASPPGLTALAPSTTTPAPSRSTASRYAYGPTTGPTSAPNSAHQGTPAPYTPTQMGPAAAPAVAPAPGQDDSSAPHSPGIDYWNGADGIDGPGLPGRPTRTPSPGTVVAPAQNPSQTPSVRPGSGDQYIAPGPAPSTPGAPPTGPTGSPLPRAVPSTIALVPTPSGPAYYRSPGVAQLTPYHPNSGTPAGVYTSPPVSSSPSTPVTYFVPYPDAPGGFLVPYPPSYTPSQEGPVPYGMPNSSPVIGTGPITFSPGTDSGTAPSTLRPGAGMTMRPLYYGFSPSAPGGRPIPYAYYGPSTPSTPSRPAPVGPIFGHGSPIISLAPGGPAPYSTPTAAPGPALAPGMALAPGPFLGSAPALAPDVIAVPAPAPSQAALCACNPADTSPRNVKIEVLSTAYNSSSTDTIKFNAYLTFTHPVQSLNSSQIRVFTRQTAEDGTKTTAPGVVSLLSPISQNCAFYSLKGYVTESNPFIDNGTDIYLGAGGANLLDACGEPFNITVAEVTQKNRLEGLLYATGIAYSEDAGVLLDDNTLNLALAFTDAVPQLRSNMFSITGPKNVTVTDLEPVDGSEAYWTFSATIPEGYYGRISVTMNAAGRRYLRSINPAAAMPGSLTIVRADPRQQGNLISSTRG